jgi:hypothetical protein
LAKIIVQNGDWDAARAELKSSLETQNAAFKASLKAAFAPTRPAQPAIPATKAAAAPPSARSAGSGLPRRPISR